MKAVYLLLLGFLKKINLFFRLRRLETQRSSKSSKLLSRRAEADSIVLDLSGIILKKQDFSSWLLR